MLNTLVKALLLGQTENHVQESVSSHIVFSNLIPLVFQFSDESRCAAVIRTNFLVPHTHIRSIMAYHRDCRKLR
jgi:hypothetical protein